MSVISDQEREPMRTQTESYPFGSCHSLGTPSQSPSSSPSRRASPSVIYYRGKPLRPSKGSPVLHPFHFIPYKIKVAFGDVDWSQQKSRVKKEEPVCPLTRRPGYPYTRSQTQKLQLKRKSDEEVIDTMPRKKQECSPKPADSRRTQKSPIRQTESSMRLPPRSTKAKRESGVVIEANRIDTSSQSTSKCYPRSKEMENEEEEDEVEYEFTDGGQESFTSSEDCDDVRRVSMAGWKEGRYEGRQEKLGNSPPRQKITLKLKMKI